MRNLSKYSLDANADLHEYWVAGAMSVATGVREGLILLNSDEKAAMRLLVKLHEYRRAYETQNENEPWMRELMLSRKGAELQFISKEQAVKMIDPVTREEINEGDALSHYHHV